jgi:hypothetical protein
VAAVSTINPGFGRLLAGCGAVLLLASLFMPWVESGGVSQTGWEAQNGLDVFFLISALLGLAAAITGGRFGFFRPDLSLNGTADITAVWATTVLAWLVIFDWPSGASREIGVYLAIAGAAAVATGTGDFKVRSLFPRMPEAERTK